MRFKTSAPSQTVVIIAVVLLVIGLLGTVLRGTLTVVNVPGDLAIWALIGSSILLLIGSLFRGM